MPLPGRDFEGEWQQLLGLLRLEAAAIGLKDLAFTLDVQPSLISHSLAERDRNFPAKWLLAFAVMSRTDDIAAYLAHARGLEVVSRRLSPEEELERLWLVIEGLGPDFAAVIKGRLGVKR